jgi:hypothetical protein
LLRSLAVGLAFLWAVDAVEPDAFGVGVVQDFDGVAVKDGDDGAGEVGGDDPGDNQEDKEERPWKRVQIREPPACAGRFGGSVLLLSERSLPDSCPSLQRLLDCDRSSDPRFMARHGRLRAYRIGVRPRDCKTEAG